MSDIVDRINEENAERFGPLCDNCSTHEKYCRCESAKLYEEFMRTGVDKRNPNKFVSPGICIHSEIPSQCLACKKDEE